MLIFKIKTWGCPQCHYTQDFDCNDANLMAKHLGLPPNICPNKCGRTLVKETVNRKEMVVLDTQDDITAKKAKFEAEEPKSVFDGDVSRLETKAERSKRIDEKVALMRIATSAEIADLRVKYEDV